jgi:hypothetical protein
MERLNAQLWHLLALVVTPANEQDRAQVKAGAEQVQEVTGEAVEIAFMDQGYTEAHPARDAAAQGMQREVVKLSQAKKGFVRLPKRRGAQFRVGGPVSPFGARLRTSAGDACWLAFPGVRYPLASTVCRVAGAKCITDSRSGTSRCATEAPAMASR